jgi:hypothetical protein
LGLTQFPVHDLVDPTKVKLIRRKATSISAKGFVGLQSPHKHGAIISSDAKVSVRVLSCSDLTFGANQFPVHNPRGSDPKVKTDPPQRLLQCI